ncbi:phage baseplate assembly protein V [Methylotenera sp.]|uniref:phage baseplate assembly protein V n=1 Tax=Methylotenera sp. TaxID=2051956 RepID=UPI00248771C0|nr:phage baseplate assembly protein V [Methylotenera sp.]MDI1298077.1 phage baseplate assembly protein V [Methylotenera sp.]
MSQTKKYYGKYRGTVVNNIDPAQLGRIMAMVPDVTGASPTAWALPCMPIAGNQHGVYVLPNIGDTVWIEFEQGDREHPIWVGGFWGSALQVPSAALAGNAANPNIVIQTPLQQGVVISDMPPSPTTGGVMLHSATGASIVVNDAGIFISNGKGATIHMVGAGVSINNGALEVI